MEKEHEQPHGGSLEQRVKRRVARLDKEAEALTENLGLPRDAKSDVLESIVAPDRTRGSKKVGPPAGEVQSPSNPEDSK